MTKKLSFGVAWPVEELENWLKRTFLKIAMAYRDDFYARIPTDGKPGVRPSVEFSGMTVSWKDRGVQHQDTPTSADEFWRLVSTTKPTMVFVTASVTFRYTQVYVATETRSETVLKWDAGSVKVSFMRSMVGGDQFTIECDFDGLVADLVDDLLKTAPEASMTESGSARASTIESASEAAVGSTGLPRVWLTSHVWAPPTGEDGCHAQEVPEGVQA